MQTPSKGFVASASTQPAVCGLQGWEVLPDDLLHSILPLLGSCRDLLAFRATCPAWRAAFSSHPSKCTLLPPLLIQPNIRVPAPHNPSDNGNHKLRTCKVIDPANPNTTLCCQIDEETLHEMYFAGSSYGQLIFCNTQYCRVVDPFSGTEVSSPHLPLSELRVSMQPIDDVERLTELVWMCEGPGHMRVYMKHFCGVLTAPLASPDSHLLLSTRISLFDWPVGSDSWYELQLPSRSAPIYQIVEFNGQFIAMDERRRLYRIQLAPQLGLREIEIAQHRHRYTWLVVCGDMLLAVARFQIHHLDMSTEPAKWVEVKNLDSWALFAGGHEMSPPFSLMRPQRWSGISKCLYYARYSPAWTVYPLGDDANPSLECYMRTCCRRMQPLWLYPSLFY